jgi:GNAT superfamily N-acetyltransferase
MTDPIDIRPLTPEDRTAWEPLWRAYLEFYNTQRGAEVYDTTFARYTDPSRPDMRAWLAWDGDRAVGLVQTIAHPHGWQIDDVTYLQDLFTAPEARGKGVARKLIETVYACADAEGRGNVYWMTNRDNHTARALYDKIAVATDFMKYTRS